MGKLNNVIPSVGNTDFDWSMYEDGWNGSSLKVNKKVKTGDSRVKVYSHEAYATDLLHNYMGHAAPETKELRKDTIVKITDFSLNAKKDTVLASINGGANNVVIDLNKEQRFFNTMTMGDTAMNKETFIACLEDPEVRAKILEMGLVAKIGSDVEKASIWDGYVENLSTEMKEQIHLNTKAYIATVLSSNNGGFVVEVANTIKAFMPGSMAAANKLTDYEAVVGQSMEVMVESYDKKIGFVVSRKKYLKTITPMYLKNVSAMLDENKDTVFTGTITGTTSFGIFVELEGYSGCLTGMLHKTLLSDALREALRQNKVMAGTNIAVFIHKIEKGRLIFSDVISSERDAVIAKREAEDLQEKSEYAAAKHEAAVKPVISADALNTNTSVGIELVNE